MPENAALQDYSELFTSTQAYISGVQEDVRSFVRMMGVDRFSRGDLAALQEVADLHFEKTTNLASVLWQNGLLGICRRVRAAPVLLHGRRRAVPLSAGRRHLRAASVPRVRRRGNPARARGFRRRAETRSRATRRPFPAPRRTAARAATTRSPAARRSRNPARRGCDSRPRPPDYAAGDVIDDRFEILEVLGQGGFSKVYRVRDDVEGKERALKLFNTAAGL